jgi:hypothetical protein
MHSIPQTTHSLTPDPYVSLKPHFCDSWSSHLIALAGSARRPRALRGRYTLQVPCGHAKKIVASPLAAISVDSLHSCWVAGFKFFCQAPAGTTTSFPAWYSLLSVKRIGLVG